MEAKGKKRNESGKKKEEKITKKVSPFFFVCRPEKMELENEVGDGKSLLHELEFPPSLCPPSKIFKSPTGAKKRGRITDDNDDEEGDVDDDD